MSACTDGVFCSTGIGAGNVNMNNSKGTQKNEKRKRGQEDGMQLRTLHSQSRQHGEQETLHGHSIQHDKTLHGQSTQHDKTLHGVLTQHDIEQYRDVGASTHAGSSPMNAGHEPEYKRHRKDEVPKLRSRKWVKKRRKKQNTEALHMSAAASNASPPALVAQEAIGPSLNLHICFTSSHPFTERS